MIIFGSIFYSIILLSQINAEEVGDSCTVARTGAIGTCKIADDCSQVNDEIRRQSLYPTICGFSERELIICCPITQTSMTTKSTTPPIRISERSK